MLLKVTVLPTYTEHKAFTGSYFGQRLILNVNLLKTAESINTSVICFRNNKNNFYLFLLKFLSIKWFFIYDLADKSLRIKCKNKKKIVVT